MQNAGIWDCLLFVYLTDILFLAVSYYLKSNAYFLSLYLSIKLIFIIPPSASCWYVIFLSINDVWDSQAGGM